jgi:phosphoesterase RecJ-like protein
MYRRIYEEIPAAKLALLCRALGSLRLFSDGRLAVASLSAEDFAQTDAEDSNSEGIIDHLRALSGVKVAMLIRELQVPGGGTAQKVSLRATDNDVDVSVMARMHGGGGHRRAAGFTSALPTPELIDAIRAQV